MTQRTSRQRMWFLPVLWVLGSHMPGCARTVTAPPAPRPPPALVCPDPGGAEPVEVRFISLAPSPYSNRHDALRAGFGIFLSLREVIATHALPMRASFHDGAEFFDDAAAIRAVLQGPRLLVVGGSTWAQGPSYYVRRFFELAGSQALTGVSATAWATAGGAHTGGEEVVSTILRSLMGAGAQAFTLGQKYMIFTTDERLDPATPGAFALLDVWYMDQFARQIAVVALAGHDRRKAEALSQALGVSPHYYMSGFPPDAQTLARFRPLQEQLNQAADPSSEAYQALRALLSPRPRPAAQQGGAGPQQARPAERPRGSAGSR
jgi:hypothetical protein